MAKFQGIWSYGTCRKISLNLIRNLGILPVVTERFFFFYYYFFIYLNFCVYSQMMLKSSSNQVWKGEYLKINSGGKITIQRTSTLRF